MNFSGTVQVRTALHNYIYLFCNAQVDKFEAGNVVIFEGIVSLFHCPVLEIAF